MDKTLHKNLGMVVHALLRLHETHGGGHVLNIRETFPEFNDDAISNLDMVLRDQYRLFIKAIDGSFTLKAEAEEWARGFLREQYKADLEHRIIDFLREQEEEVPRAEVSRAVLGLGTSMAIQAALRRLVDEGIVAETLVPGLRGGLYKLAKR